jgi:FG-GAP repeat protein
MRAWGLLLLVGCRNALGIPGETSVREFSVNGTITGLTGISTPTQLMLDTSVYTPAGDGPIAFGVPNGTAATVTPSSGACVVTSGGDVEIDGADVGGLEVKCDGYLALGELTPSAPFDVAFDATKPTGELVGSVIEQQTALDYTFAYADATAVPVLDAQPYATGTVRALTGTSHELAVTVRNDSVAAFWPTRDYKITIDTSQAPKAYASIDVGGAAVAAFGDRIVVGVTGVGADVFRQHGRTWEHEAVLVAPPGLDGFGASVAITNGRIVIGAPEKNSGGAAYVYDLDVDKWQVTATLRAKTPVQDDEFGAAVAVNPNVIAVGAPGDACHAGGCVFAFLPNGSVAELDGKRAGDRLGASVAASATQIAAGAPGDDSSTTDPADDSFPDAGAVYVATTSLANAQYVKAAVPGAEDGFGSAVAIDGDALVIGAPLEDAAGGDPTDNTASAAGAAYVFRLVGGAWLQRQYVKAPAVHVGDAFGGAVAILSNRVDTTTTCVVAIGAPFDDANDTQQDAGAVYAYALDLGDPASALTRAGYATAPTPRAGANFGATLALTPQNLVGGAPFDGATGAAYAVR